MEFIVKRTSELSNSERTSILDLFNEIFHEKRTPEEFLNQYLNNDLGYSYHSLILDKEEIVGATAFVPNFYCVHTDRFLFAVSIDTMIRKSHRGIENFFELINGAFQILKEDGITFVIGFPNDNSHPIFTKTHLMNDIGRLNTFCLPINIGGIKSQLKHLNFLSKILCRVWLFISTKVASDKIFSFPIHRDYNSFNLTRYKRMDGDYCHVDLKGMKFIYKLKTIVGIRTATLIDVIPKSEENFCKATKYIVENEKNNFDSLLYVGHLPFRNIGMIKVPKKFEPKIIYFNGAILNRINMDASSFFNINNWDVNLADFDLI